VVQDKAQLMDTLLALVVAEVVEQTTAQVLQLAVALVVQVTF
jgi:hypothetical protein